VRILIIEDDYDLIILDVMLPSMNGWDILKGLRQNGRQALAIFLTAKDMIEDKVKGLDLGADSYIIKPFAFSELLAVIRSLVRRGPSRVNDNTIVIGDLSIDLIARVATRQNKRLDLTQKEFSLLTFLSRRQGEVLTRTVIAEHVWDMFFDSETNVVDVHVRRLRSKVDDPFESKLIHTVRGVGYVLRL
jgi:two-component system copper resistance phosphate regulon response regulator CusR